MAEEVIDVVKCGTVVVKVELLSKMDSSTLAFSRNSDYIVHGLNNKDCYSSLLHQCKLLVVS